MLPRCLPRHRKSSQMTPQPQALPTGYLTAQAFLKPQGSWSLRCFPDAAQMLPRCFPCFPCFPDAPQVLPRCFPDVPQMLATTSKFLPDDSSVLHYPKWLPDSSSASEATWLSVVQDAGSSNFEHFMALSVKIGKMDSRSPGVEYFLALGPEVDKMASKNSI